MDKNTLLGTWVDKSDESTKTFEFREDSFDANGNLVQWPATVVIRLRRTGGICYDAVMSMTHRCEVTQIVSPNKVMMIDRETSCTAQNFPVHCTHTVIIKCGPYLRDHVYDLTYDTTRGVLVCKQTTSGQGEEYTGTYVKVPLQQTVKTVQLKDISNVEAAIRKSLEASA